MKTISATKCTTYKTCGRQFYFTYILRLLQLDDSNLIIGNAYHDSLERYHKNNQQLSDTEIDAITKKWLPQQTQRDSVKSFVHRYMKNPVPVSGSCLCEMKFKINIPGLPIELEGKIDRLDDDKIVEYKTSGFKYKEENVKTIQSRFYCYVVRQLRGKNLPIVYSVLNKKTKLPPQIMEVKYTDEELDAVPVEIVEIYNSIEKKDFNKNVGVHCLWCAYGERKTNNCN